MKIKDLPKIERPREKLEKYGPEPLTTSELLAILLRTGGQGINVVELASKILKTFSGPGLAAANVKELKDTYGLGAAKACEIVACFELGRRLLQNKQSASVVIAASRGAMSHRLPRPLPQGKRSGKPPEPHRT